MEFTLWDVGFSTCSASVMCGSPSPERGMSGQGEVVVPVRPARRAGAWPRSLGLMCLYTPSAWKLFFFHRYFSLSVKKNKSAQLNQEWKQPALWLPHDLDLALPWEVKKLTVCLNRNKTGDVLRSFSSAVQTAQLHCLCCSSLCFPQQSIRPDVGINTTWHVRPDLPFNTSHVTKRSSFLFL